MRHTNIFPYNWIGIQLLLAWSDGVKVGSEITFGAVRCMRVR